MEKRVLSPRNAERVTQAVLAVIRMHDCAVADVADALCMPRSTMYNKIYRNTFQLADVVNIMHVLGGDVRLVGENYDIAIGYSDC